MAREDSPKEELKDLEKRLADELDQKVRLSEATDARLENSVQLNPNISDSVQQLKANAQKAVESPPLPPKPNELDLGDDEDDDDDADNGMSLNKNVDQISLDDVDSLLHKLDSNFKTSLDEIKTEISKVQVPVNLESISISADYLKEGDETDVVSVATVAPAPTAEKVKAHKDHFIEALVMLALHTLWVPFHMLISMVPGVLGFTKHPPKEALQVMLGLAKPPLQSWRDRLQRFLKLLTSYSFMTYVQTLVLLVLAGGLYVVGRDITSNFRVDAEKDPFLRSFSEVATSMQIIPDEDGGEDLESPLKHPEYTVFVHKITSNLKSPSPNRNPMVVVELYIVASNQECAIEIHNREAEVRDIIERIFEQTTFDELETPEGKARLKSHIRGNLNRVLNRGSAKGIYFKSLNMVPG